MAELTRLGKYEVRRELGHGAMGVVYEGFDPMIQRAVALKTIRPDQLAGAHAKEILERFRREAQAAGRLTHPNIVSIYDFGEDAGVWYIAMELVAGRELKEYFDANERFAIADIVRILEQILAALGYSHQQGVVHRDIKPSNVFILADGTAKVADFGIAHLESSDLTQVGTVLGTPAYMSPEQILGLPVDGRSDLFSVGVMLYQFLTGERPFTGNATITMRKVLEEDPLPPSRFNVQIPGAMDAVVRRALAKKPDERFPTAEEFVAALRAAARAEGGHSGETTLVPPPTIAGARTAATPATTTAAAGRATSGTGTPQPQRKSKATLAALAGLGVVVAVAAGIWLAWQGADDSKAAQDPTVAQVTAPAAAAAPAVAPPVGAGTQGGGGAGPAAPPAAPTPVAAPSPTSPGSLVISAVGFVDPSQPRYQSDQALMRSDLRADSRGQLVAKAVGMLVETQSVAKNYDVLRDRLLSKSGEFVTTVMRESAPTTGKDGLVSITTEAIVDVKAIQKSLNEMSRNERIDFIRASGDPRVAVRIVTRDADAPDAPPRVSPTAENILKERIKSFGFRTWTEDAPRKDGTADAPDFIVEGEATIKRLSMRLAASGLVVTKYALNGWTIKCTDRATGEEIYFNTKLPAGDGSWPTEADALKAIGTKIASEFSRDFFLQHVAVTGRRVVLRVEGLPPAIGDDALRRELVAMPSVITVAPPGGPQVFEIQLAGNGPAGDLVAAGILKPLNAKLGQACFSVGAVAGDQVNVTFDARCNDAAVIARLETNPPAALYGAPSARQKAVVKNPDTLRKLMI
ncbi:MAG: serine/threonine protein kinase [Burkholderiales bacterium]|nr:serine/threonine protein kinase [Burkholderiales bacterium]